MPKPAIPHFPFRSLTKHLRTCLSRETGTIQENGKTGHQAIKPTYLSKSWWINLNLGWCTRTRDSTIRSWWFRGIGGPLLVTPVSSRVHHCSVSTRIIVCAPYPLTSTTRGRENPSAIFEGHLYIQEKEGLFQLLFTFFFVPSNPPYIHPNVRNSSLGWFTSHSADVLFFFNIVWGVRTFEWVCGRKVSRSLL